MCKAVVSLSSDYKKGPLVIELGVSSFLFIYLFISLAL